MIYENGSLLAASDRFSFEEQLVVSEIDVERLRGERLTNTTFSSSVRMYRDQHPMQHISTALVASRDLTLTRSVELIRLCLLVNASWTNVARRFSLFR